MTQNRLKEISEILILFYVLIVFLAFFEQHLFYNYFSVSIYYLISINELLFYAIPYFIINNIKVLISASTIGMGILFLWIYYLINGKSWNVNKRNRSYFISFSLIGFLIWAYVISLALSKEPFNWFIEGLIYWLSKGSVFNFLFQLIFLFWCLIVYFSFKEYFASKMYYTIFMIIFFVFTLSSMKTLVQINLTTKMQTDEYHFNYLGNKTYTAKDTAVIIGTTRDFIIIRNFKDSTNHFYEMSKIDSLVIKRFNP